MQDVATPDRVSGHERDHRLRHGADVALELEHVQARNPALADIAGLPADPLITTGTEGELAVLGRPVAGEEDHTDLRILPGVLERLLHLEKGVGPKGVAHLRPVERDARDTVALVVRDVFVRFHFFPIGLAHDGWFLVIV